MAQSEGEERAGPKRKKKPVDFSHRLPRPMDISENFDL
jgi:hypothetical protein